MTYLETIKWIIEFKRWQTREMIDQVRDNRKNGLNYGFNPRPEHSALPNLVILDLASEVIAARQKKCGNCEYYDNVMMYCSDDCGREMGEHEFCSRWEPRDAS